MPSTNEITPSPATLPDRRKSVRLDVLDQLDGRVVMYNIPIKVRDISEGGVATESAIPFPAGSRHLLRLTAWTGVEIVIAGTVVHGMTASQGARRVFLTGFQFVPDRSQRTADALQRLLAAVGHHAGAHRQ
jgi:hypothetical protein